MPQFTKTAKDYQKRMRVTETGCWELTLKKVRRGYSIVCVQGKFLQAHRYFYEQLRGPIPPGFELDHLCGNTRCVNPDHCQPVRPKENKMRSSGPTALNHKKRFCKRGHPLSGDNVIRYTHNGVTRRVCRKCRDGARHRKKDFGKK